MAFNYQTSLFAMPAPKQNSLATQFSASLMSWMSSSARAAVLSQTFSVLTSRVALAAILNYGARWLFAASLFAEQTANQRCSLCEDQVPKSSKSP